MSNDDFLSNKKKSVPSRKNMHFALLCYFFLFILHHLWLIQSKFNAFYNFHDFLRPFNYHYLNAPFHFSKNNVEADSVLFPAGCLGWDLGLN